MKAIVALEELIKQDETHYKTAKKQLADHEAGTNRFPIWSKRPLKLH